MISFGDHNKIMSDRNIFNQIVYTPLSEALEILKERRKDKKLVEKIESMFCCGVPNILKESVCGVLARQVATPNFDTQRFIKICDENQLKPVLFEYPEDKFASRNPFKHSLCKINVHKGINKKGEYLFEKINIVDLVKYDGKKLKDIKTSWGEPLIDFHRKLFSEYGIISECIFYDISDWYKQNGGVAKEYYYNYMLLFLAHGILFENFLLKSDESDFTKNVLLPAMEKIESVTGLKPLIVPLSLLDIEDESYWISHPSKIKQFIISK